MMSLADLAAAIAETLAPGSSGALSDPRRPPALVAQTPIGDPDEDEGGYDDDDEDEEEDEDEDEPPMELTPR